MFSGEKIVYYRTLKGISQAQLAEAIGVAPSAIAAYELGSRIPKIEVRQKIAEVLHIDPVSMSGIELSQEDELRLLNILLVKYCRSMCVHAVDDNNSEGYVEVDLPMSFENIAEKYADYRKEIDKSEAFCNLLNGIQQLDVIKGGRTEIDNPVYDDEANKKMQFYLETWPEYDVEYQKRNQNISSIKGGFTIEDFLKSRFITDYIDYQKRLENKK